MALLAYISLPIFNSIKFCNSRSLCASTWSTDVMALLTAWTDRMRINVTAWAVLVLKDPWNVPEAPDIVFQTGKSVMDSWIVWMEMMNANVQETSVWDKISFIVNKIRPASKLLKGIFWKIYYHPKIGILLPKLFWPTFRKIVPVIEKLLKFEAEGQEFVKFLRSLEQFIQTSEQFLVTECFLTCSWRFLKSNTKLKHLNWNWKNDWDLEVCRKSLKSFISLAFLLTVGKKCCWLQWQKTGPSFHHRTVLEDHPEKKSVSPMTLYVS